MKTFQVFTTQELIELCKGFKWNRVPKELHIHHTWKPDHSNFNGGNHQQLQYGMWNYHVNTLGWSDIGQHLSLMPDGTWVAGRDFNKNPASISGRNYLGFAIEMIGNFDVGNDKLEGKQLESMIEFSAFFGEFFGYSLPNYIVFHREHSGKTCPGNSIDKTSFVNQIQAFLDKKNAPVDTRSWQQKLGEDAVRELETMGLVSNADDWCARDLENENTPLWLFFEITRRLAERD